MSVMPAPHPPEFRQRAVQLAREGASPVAKIAKDLGISESCLRNWMAQADADENGGPRLTSAEKKELSELRPAEQGTGAGKRDPAPPTSGVSVGNPGQGAAEIDRAGQFRFAGHRVAERHWLGDWYLLNPPPTA
jgi:transposase